MVAPSGGESAATGSDEEEGVEDDVKEEDADGATMTLTTGIQETKRWWREMGEK